MAPISQSAAATVAELSAADQIAATSSQATANPNGAADGVRHSVLLQDMRRVA